MSKFLKSAAVFSAIVAASISTVAIAGPVVSGFSANTFARNDDGATGSINLGFTANYFGNVYSSTYVSNNGYLTFNNGQGTYTPGGLGSGYVGQPIIAAFFADVDTRAGGSALTSYGNGTFAGRAAFGATWDGVGYYNSRDDKLNSFQILLVDRNDVGSGDFDIYLNYNQIVWETGSASGGSNGFGGVSAAAGYNAGNGNAAGTFYEFPGSRENGRLLDGGINSLTANSNVGIAGRYVFNVRAGAVTPGAPGAVPEPATWAMMLTGFGLVGHAMRRRRPTPQVA